MALTKITGSGLGTLTSDVDAQGSSGATLKLTSTDTTGADTELLGQIDFVSSDTSTGSAGTQARIKGVYEDNGDSTGIAFLAGASTGSGTPTISEVMRIRHEGRVGINETSPSTFLHIDNGGANGSGQADAVRLHNPGTTAGDGAGIKFSAGTSTTGAGIFGIGQALNSCNLVFRAGGDTERMRITSVGDLLLGTTSLLSDGKVSIAATLTTRAGMTMKNLSTQGSGQTYIRFTNNSDAIAGSIQHTGTTTTNYGTSSDYRLKENVADMTGAIARVKALAPKRFNFIADADTTVDGFLAHEAQTVVPEAVMGTHNEVDDDNNPIMQQIDHSKLVPLLTGALKEAVAKIEALEARVKTLEEA